MDIEWKGIMDIEWQGKQINFMAFCREQKKLNKLVTGVQNHIRYAVLLDSVLADEFNSEKTDKERVPLVVLTQSMADKTLGIVCLDENLKPSRMAGSGELLASNPDEKQNLTEKLRRVLTRKRLLSMHPEFALARAIATSNGSLCDALLRDRPDLLVISEGLLRLFGDYSEKLPQAVLRHCYEAGVDLGDLVDFIVAPDSSDFNGKFSAIRRGAFHLMARSPRIETEVYKVYPCLWKAFRSSPLLDEFVVLGKYALIKELLQTGCISGRHLSTSLLFKLADKEPIREIILEALSKGMNVIPPNFMYASPETIQWAVDSPWGKELGLDSEIEKHFMEAMSGERVCEVNILIWAASKTHDEDRLKMLLDVCAKSQRIGVYPMYGQKSNQVRLLGVKRQVIKRLVGVIGEAAYLDWLHIYDRFRGVVAGCEAWHVEMLFRLVDDERRREFVGALVGDFALCLMYNPTAVRDDIAQRLSQLMPHDTGAVHRLMLRHSCHNADRPELFRQKNEILLRYIDHCPEDGKKLQHLLAAFRCCNDIQLHQFIGQCRGGSLYDNLKLIGLFRQKGTEDHWLNFGRFMQEHDPEMFPPLLGQLCSEMCHLDNDRMGFKVLLNLVKTEEELSLLPAIMDDIKTIAPLHLEEVVSVMEKIRLQRDVSTGRSRISKRIRCELRRIITVQN